jgi:glycosyltransferase involved in cell wall biosynthesis
MNRMIPSLRVWDVYSANLVDRFIVNSRYVADRVARYYHRSAEIVFPPVAVESYITQERSVKDFYLFFGQLTGYKRADIAIEACIRSGRKLVVAGSGARGRDIKRYAKSGLVSFAGRVSEEEKLRFYSQAKALLFPGIEDFGLVPVEANAAGCPVIAYRKGGVLDSVKEGVTGLFFDEQNPASLIRAMDDFEKRESPFSRREAFTDQVRQFSKEAFLERMGRIIAERKRV